ncbi:RiPP maturation radical SAM C-methyltransferase [Engelhardtia mirabilis]|uniref:Radical SAM superfamily protein n=1 Tax=Engelhardtia mirabilis TaxID=2528011 RepID=A0A518BLA7_9BACT|nr:Radical SAM superfamily protein [Planctomycetes bacterium Pla133]QDV02086.1 Radical SAM superfamily protein [Planctomycetes bacterium Pla86]
MIQPKNTSRVSVVVMPWAECARPSLPAGILKALLERGGMAADVIHANVDFACELGQHAYAVVASGKLWTFTAEWVFSRAAFPESRSESGVEAVDKWLPLVRESFRFKDYLGEDFREWIADLRDVRAPALIEDVAGRTNGYDVVAFTCSVNQLVPALAAARRIKELRPKTFILFGGAQVEGEMGDEVMRAFAWVDAVFQGEAEDGGLDAFRWALGEADEAPPQLIHRDATGGIVGATTSGRLEDMNGAPTPLFDEYFDAVRGVRDARGEQISVSGLMFESARGCWWGEVHHCTFCGLNGGNMKFRAKDPERVLDEVLGLADRYRQLTFHAADNIISQGYRRTLLPALAEADLGLEFFYETKSNLSRADVKQLRDARVRAIQPGVESLSSHVLELMDKGVSGIRNVQLLKFCREYGVEVAYNILCGFPGEVPEDYLQQAELTKRLHHLAPPSGVGDFMLQRFSPMHFDAPRFGIKDVQSHRAYAHIFPSDGVDLNRLAFYFRYKLEHPPIARRLKSELRKLVRRWQARWEKGSWMPELTFRRARSWVLVQDARDAKARQQYVLSGPEMEVFLAADEIRSVDRIARDIGRERDEVLAAVTALDGLGLVMVEGEQVLTLALPRAKAVVPRFEYELDAPQFNVRPEDKPGGGANSSEELERRPSRAGREALTEA